jgi:hypothetical protein
MMIAWNNLSGLLVFSGVRSVFVAGALDPVAAMAFRKCRLHMCVGDRALRMLDSLKLHRALAKLAVR